MLHLLGSVCAQQSNSSENQLGIDYTVFKTIYLQGDSIIKYRAFKKLIKSDAIAAIQFQDAERLVTVGDVGGILGSLFFLPALYRINQFTYNNANLVNPKAEQYIVLYFSVAGSVLVASHLINLKGREKKRQATNTYNRNNSKSTSLNFTLSTNKIGLVLLF